MSKAVIIRPYLVVNGYGEFLGSSESWDEAHLWAHWLVRNEDPALPVEVVDQSQRVTRQITRTDCVLIAWTVLTRIAGCEPTPTELAPFAPHASEVFRDVE